MNRQQRREAARNGDAVVGLSFDTAWCPRHLEAIRDEPPAVGVAAMGNLLQFFMSDPLVRQDPEIETIFDIGPATEAYSPLCCYLGDEAVAEIHRLAVEQGR